MNEYVITRVSEEEADELYHHGVKGMKWGHRKQLKYQNLVNRTKQTHSESRYNRETKSYSDELNSMKKKRYSKWAKDNYMDSYSKNDQKKIYNDYAKELQDNIKVSKQFAKKSGVLSKRLDNIDTSSLTYKEAKKMVRQISNDWFNETWESTKR